MNYLSLLEIADLLAELLDFEDVTSGTIDTSLEKTVGVYQRAEFTPRECIGTESSYEVLKARILVHWTDSPVSAEQKAYETADLFRSFDNMNTAEHTIKFADVKAVRSIGKDEKGICEYIIDTDIIYTERKE